MKHSLLCFIISFCFFSCETRQWNLNRTIGWGDGNNQDFAVLLIKWQDANLTKLSSYAVRKTQLEQRILEVLKADRLGDEGERDSGDTNMLFIVPGNYKQALESMVRVLNSSGQQGNLAVYKREYLSYDRWNDSRVYPYNH